MLDMHSTMMENGLDFILDAATELKSSEETTDSVMKRKNIKYSLLHLLSGIELVLKSRLYIENWTYIFSSMDKADKTKFVTGDFVSVECSNCTERLERLCNIKISADDKNTFDELRKSRNQVEHFYSTESAQALESKINKALTAIIQFIKSNYEEFVSPSIVDLRKNEMKALSDTEKKYIEDINTVLADLSLHHKDALDLALKRTENILAPGELMICPDCGENTLVINDDEADNRCHCYFCNYIDSGENVSRKYLSKILHLEEYSIVRNGGEYPLFTCPDCGKDSFVKINNSYVCFSCRMMYNEDEIRKCEECGVLYTCYNKYDEGLCDSCREWLKEKIEKE